MVRASAEPTPAAELATKEPTREGEGPSMFATTFARRRKDRKISQSQIARALGISQSAVSSWEAGDTVPSDHQTVYVLETMLGYSPGRLTRLLWRCAPASQSRRKSRVDVAEAIEDDERLSEFKKRVLLSLYREFLEEHDV